MFAYLYQKNRIIWAINTYGFMTYIWLYLKKMIEFIIMKNKFDQKRLSLFCSSLLNNKYAMQTHIFDIYGLNNILFLFVILLDILQFFHISFKKNNLLNVSETFNCRRPFGVSTSLYSLEPLLRTQSGISSAVSDEAMRNLVADTYRLHEQSAISATKFDALIATAWYRIKLKGKPVIAKVTEKGKGSSGRADNHGSGLRVHKFVDSHAKILNDPTMRRQSSPYLCVDIPKTQREIEGGERKRKQLLSVYVHVPKWE